MSRRPPSIEAGDDQLVDLVYDAALDDSLWPNVLERLGDRVHAHPGNLTNLNFLSGHGVGLAARSPEDIMSRYFSEWAQRNPIALAESPADYTVGWVPRITRDSQSVDRQVLERSAFWNEFLVPIGAYHLAILRLSLRRDEVTTITLGRPNHLGAFADGDIAALQPWLRHLVRAERVSRSLGLRQAMIDQFDTLLADSSNALFFVDDEFKLLRRTVPADALLERDGALRVVGGQLRAARMASDAALRHALTLALSGGAPLPVVVEGAKPEDTLVLSIARLSERAMNGLTSARCLLVSVRALDPPNSAGALRRTFGLTTAEAELTIALTGGASLSMAAQLRGVSINTVRSQLTSIFDKTGCHRQQDLVRLLTTHLR